MILAIKSGDTLSLIAERHNTTVDQLMKLNKQIKNKNLIYPGQKIILPPPSIEVILNKSKKENQFTNAPLDSVCATCPLKRQDACLVEKMTVRCGHDKRSFILNVLKDANKGKSTRGEEYVLQVIAGKKKPDQLIVEVEGKCKYGKASTSSQAKMHHQSTRRNIEDCCPTALIRGADVWVDQAGIVQADVYSQQTEVCNEDFKDFFKKIFIPNQYPEKYTIQANTCSGKSNIQATVEAFAPVEWKGKVALGYSHDSHKDSNFNQSQGYKNLKAHGKWNVSGEISVKHDDSEWKLGASVSVKGRHNQNNNASKYLFKGAQGFLDKLSPLLSGLKSDSAAIGIKWPKLEIGGEVKNTEATDAYDVGVEGNIKVGFNPLFGATLTMDILDVILSAAEKTGHPLAALLTRAKKVAAKGVGNKHIGGKADISIDITLDGDIGGQFNFNTTGHSEWEAAGQVTSTLNIMLEGRVDVDGHFFVFEVSAGAKAGAKSGVEGILSAGVKNNQPVANGRLKFLGVTVYYACYYKVAKKDDTTKDQGMARPGFKTNHKTPIMARPGKVEVVEVYGEAKKEFIWIEPAFWPKDEKAFEIAKGE